MGKGYFSRGTRMRNTGSRMGVCGGRETRPSACFLVRKKLGLRKVKEMQ